MGKVIKLLQDPDMVELVWILLKKYGEAEITRQAGEDIEYHVFQDGDIGIDEIKDYLKRKEIMSDKVRAFLQAHQDWESERTWELLNS